MHLMSIFNTFVCWGKTWPLEQTKPGKILDWLGHFRPLFTVSRLFLNRHSLFSFPWRWQVCLLDRPKTKIGRFVLVLFEKMWTPSQLLTNSKFGVANFILFGFKRFLWRGIFHQNLGRFGLPMYRHSNVGTFLSCLHACCWLLQDPPYPPTLTRLLETRLLEQFSPVPLHQVHLSWWRWGEHFFNREFVRGCCEENDP